MCSSQLGDSGRCSMQTVHISAGFLRDFLAVLFVSVCDDFSHLFRPVVLVCRMLCVCVKKRRIV